MAMRIYAAPSGSLFRYPEGKAPKGYELYKPVEEPETVEEPEHVEAETEAEPETVEEPEPAPKSKARKPRNK